MRGGPWIYLISGAILVCGKPAFASSTELAQTTKGLEDVESSQASVLQPRGRLGWGNDQLYLENGDDLGFTQDLLAGLHLLDADDDYSLSITHRLITERFGLRRTDEFTWRLRWLRDTRYDKTLVSLGPSATLALSGNFGGARLQNTWHRAIDNAYTFNHGLANEYPEYRVGLVPGMLIGITSEPWWWLRLAVGTELALALGRTGRGRAALYNGIELESGPEGFRLALSFGVDYERTWTSDPFLKLPGAYDTELVWVSPYFRLAARTDSWEAGYRAVTNMGGAETQFGVVYFMLGGGNAFRHEHAQR